MLIYIQNDLMNGNIFFFAAAKNQLVTNPPLRTRLESGLESVEHQVAVTVLSNLLNIHTELKKKKIGAMQFFLALTLILAYSLDTANGSCEGSLDLENGRFFTRSNNLVIFQCNRGFVLQGNSIHTCDRDGRLREKKPFCASEC